MHSSERGITRSGCCPRTKHSQTSRFTMVDVMRRLVTERAALCLVAEHGYGHEDDYHARPCEFSRVQEQPCSSKVQQPHRTATTNYDLVSHHPLGSSSSRSCFIASERTYASRGLRQHCTTALCSSGAGHTEIAKNRIARSVSSK